MSISSNRPEFACELLKLLRGMWLTRAQIAQELGIKVDTASEWAEEWQRQGLLDVREGAKPARGHAPKEYTLSPCWIGGAR